MELLAYHGEPLHHLTVNIMVIPGQIQTLAFFDLCSGQHCRRSEANPCQVVECGRQSQKNGYVVSRDRGGHRNSTRRGQPHSDMRRTWSTKRYFFTKNQVLLFGGLLPSVPYAFGTTPQRRFPELRRSKSSRTLRGYIISTIPNLEGLEWIRLVLDCHSCKI